MNPDPDRTIQAFGFGDSITQSNDIFKLKPEEYHILVIAADGQVSKVEETMKSIEKASDYPLAIIIIGVVDGPWDMMDLFDNLLPQSRYDNFQFVNFHHIMSTSKNPQATLALHALMEIPDQYKAIKNLRLLNKLNILHVQF